MVEISADELAGLRHRLQAVERTRAELDLVLSLTRAIAEARNFEAALEISVRMICDYAGWVVGEVWMPNANATALEPAPVHHLGADDAALQAFVDASELCRFPRGTGLPGRVWATGRAEWVPDVAHADHAVYLRVSAAARAGLGAAVAVPIGAGAATLAVLVFYLRQATDEDPHRVDVVTAAAAQLGAVLLNKHAEAVIERQARELLELSTPVMEVLPGIVLAPLIGRPDDRRLAQLTERLLDAVVRRRARVALIDITGVPEVETNTARLLMNAAKAARLVGAEVVLTGVRPAIARTLVSLGIQLPQMSSCASLAAGLALAMRES